MGALPPTPQDLSQFPSRVDGWFVVAIGGCRTLKRLDRRIGLRRDATRAPTQARSGWRPSGRLLDSPQQASLDAALAQSGWVVVSPKKARRIAGRQYWVNLQFSGKQRP